MLSTGLELGCTRSTQMPVAVNQLRLNVLAKHPSPFVPVAGAVICVELMQLLLEDRNPRKGP